MPNFRSLWCAVVLVALAMLVGGCPAPPAKTDTGAAPAPGDGVHMRRNTANDNRNGAQTVDGSKFHLNGPGSDGSAPPPPPAPPSGGK
jgi:hypothetical protein